MAGQKASRKNPHQNNNHAACETCMNYVYDEEIDMYECVVNLDEDEMMHYLTQRVFSCPYYRLDDEYGTVRKQI